MACGDIFQAGKNYFLQIGERENDNLAPFVLLTEEESAQDVIGCDPGFPFFFIRKRTDGSFPDKDYFINMFDDRIFAVSCFISPPVKTLNRIHMEEIQKCAKRHKMLSIAAYKYLTL